MTNTRPNIVFILMDDLGWRDIGCYGSSFYETPNLDKLARDGMRFTDAYASCPVCSPTRASAMTGKYPARVGITNYIGGHTKGRVVDVPYLKELPLEEHTIASAMKEGGYATWHVGKWHLGDRDFFPDKHGFDVNVAGCHWGRPMNGYFSPWGIENLEDGPEGEYLTDRLTSEALSLIERRDTEKPFFLNLAYYAVHGPIQAKPELIAKYEQKARMLGLDKQKTFEWGDRFPGENKRTRHIQRRLLQSDAAYAAMIQTVDDNIGRLIDGLKAESIFENTVILFTSDNGGLSSAEGSPTCNAPLQEGKGWMYEGGVREPLLVHAPGLVPEDSTCTVPVTTPDFFPTFLDLAGLPLKPEQQLDGESLLPLLRDPNAGLQRDAIFWHFPHYGNQGGTPGCSIRMGDYKLIEFFEDSRLELYNLREDIGEEHNLAAECPEKAAELHQRLIAWREEVEALIPQPNPDWPGW